MTASNGRSRVGRGSLTKAELLEILDNSPVVTYCCGPGPQYPTTYISETVTAQLGYRPEDYYRDPLFWTKCIHPEDVESVLAELDRVSHGELIKYEYRMRCANGQYIWLHDEVHPLYAQRTGSVRGLVGSWIDVSAVRSAKDVMERTVAELETLYRTAPIGLGFIDKDLRFARVNEQLAAFNGAPVTEHIGRTLRSVIPEIASQVEPLYRHVFETGDAIRDTEVKGTTPAQPGIERSWLVNYAPVQLADGTLLGANTVVSDITQIKQIMEQLKKYEHIVSATPDMISFVNTEYQYEAVNDAYTIAHGRARDELIGHHVAEILGESVFRKVVKPLIDRCLAGESIRYQDWFDFAGVGRRFTDVSYSRSVDDAGAPQGVAVSVRDMTEQQRVEEQLRASQSRLEEISNTIEDVVWITDVKSRVVTYASPAYEKIWGYTVQSLYQNPNQWIDAIHHDDLPRIREALRELARGLVYDEEFQITRSDGGLRWIRDRGYPIFDDAGNPLHLVGIAQDITERKRSEETKSRLEAELRHAHKMQAVGQLAAGLAHDVNSVLMIILGNAELLQSALKTGNQSGSTKVRSSLENITSAVERGKSLIDQLLCLGRSQAHNPQPTDLNGVLRDLAGMIRQVVGTSIDVDLSCAQSLPRCNLDNAQLLRAIVNLVTNARDAMPKGGRLKIETSTAQRVRDNYSAPDDGRLRSFVVLTISDSGVGMDTSVKDRIFEPFYSTKPVGQGSGLGLSVVHGILEQNDGHAEVESTPGRGTNFRMYFPAID